MRASRLSDERGVALAVAIFALVVIGALIAGTFFAGRLEQQTGRNTLFVAQAAEAAEAGLSDAISSGSGATYAAMPLGGSVDLADLTLSGHLSATRSVSRLTSSVYLIRALGNRTDAGGNVLATRSAGSLVRMAMPDLQIKGGLTALGDVVVTGNSTVSGNDQIPAAWATGVSCPALDTVAGIRYNGSLSAGGSSQISGDPPMHSDPTLNSSNIFGNSSFEQLKALRTLTLTGNISGLAAAVTGTPPRCNTSVQNNWGAPTDPASPCFNYFPIIYHYGNLSLSGNGAGQGILLVEGNLNAQGQIDFYGPVIVTGEVDIRGTGSDAVKFYGGVLAQDVQLDDSRLSGNATVNYSSCAIQRALQGSATIQPLSERAWVQLY
ncbi:hypothetical protein BH24GEM1_BH24GEM1_07190 [soil metagenome]